MPEPRSLPKQGRLERPKPQTIKPPEKDNFPPSLQELAQRTEGERKEQEWKALTNFVLLKAEGDRILDGIKILQAMESGEGADVSKLRSPNFREAQGVVSEWQRAFPGKDVGEIADMIRIRIQNNIGREAGNLAAQGIEAPTGVKYEALEDYITTAPIAERLLRGLEQNTRENSPATPERARAQHYLANNGLRSPQEGIRHVQETMQNKRAILQRLGIQVP